MKNTKAAAIMSTSHRRSLLPIWRSHSIIAAQVGEATSIKVFLCKFFIACMLVAPIAILFGFLDYLYPGSTDLSPDSKTLWLWRGTLAMNCVNAAFVVDFEMTMRNPWFN